MFSKHINFENWTSDRNSHQIRPSISDWFEPLDKDIRNQTFWFLLNYITTLSKLHYMILMTCLCKEFASSKEKFLPLYVGFSVTLFFYTSVFPVKIRLSIKCELLVLSSK